MIKNDLQYRVAKAALKRFRTTLEHHDELTAKEKSWVREAHKATIVGEIMKLQSDVEEYERLKKGDDAGPPLDLLAEIPGMLIRKRIALGWTQEDLAKRLGVRAQQVQHDEATDYESASLSRLMRTAKILQHARSRTKKVPQRKSARG